MIDIEAVTIAAEYVGTLDNASGQLCQMKDGKSSLILFELGCPNCSEVASKIADEWGDAITLLINSAPALLDSQRTAFDAAAHFFHCRECAQDSTLCQEGEMFARGLGLMG